ncbi:MAG TPA: hypothetical protein VK171_15665 [Fimbriimonas sp.]|nr:hypothetical protein [Fimbriimonas sp.]
MKTGDPKQVAALGVVALLAVGYVGSTAFKTIQQNSYSGPVIVEDLGKDGVVATDGTAKPMTAPSGVADVFADSFEAPPKPEEPIQVIEAGSLDTTAPIVPTIFQAPMPDPMQGTTEPAEPEVKTEKPEKPKPPKVEKKTTAVVYMGFIESSSSSAILSVNGATHTVSEGDPIGNGFVVKSISSETITVKSATATYSISIGKEKQIS